MYSPSVFASLTPCDEKNKARSAFKLPQNERWFHEATGGIAEEPTIDSREPTPAPEASSRDQDLGATDRLIVTFDELLKELENFPNGIQFGTNPVVCHVLLGHRGTGGISGRQYNITVDDNLCIWLHDYHSTHGTAVAHNGQNETEVRKDTWLLAFEPGSRKRLKNITIHSGGLVVKLEFPNHGEADTQYVANLRAFVKKCKGAVLPVGALGLDSEPTTATPSQAQTPGERPVYYNDGKIGEGEFGVVRRFIKLRDGKYFAAKSFLRTPNKRRHDQDNPEWLAMIRREFTIMRDNPHPNVMRVIEFRDSPNPLIIMDYYEHGNITEAVVAHDQYVTAFGQILDGLSHLHARGATHRDLKPENFLVEKFPFFKVVITDFGFSKVVKDNTVLKTFCGTLKYVAPEAFPGISQGYDSSIDVWATGVILLEWLYGIPQPPSVPKPRNRNEKVSDGQWYEWIETWCQWLLKKLEDEDDAAVEILLHMIEIKPRRRWSADRCLDRGFENGLFKRRAADDLVVSVHDPNEAALQAEEGGDGTKTPTVASPLDGESSQRAQAGIDPEATIILGNLWEGAGAANSPSASIEGSPSKRRWTTNDTDPRDLQHPPSGGKLRSLLQTASNRDDNGATTELNESDIDRRFQASRPSFRVMTPSHSSLNQDPSQARRSDIDNTKVQRHDKTPVNLEQAEQNPASLSIPGPKESGGGFIEHERRERSSYNISRDPSSRDRFDIPPIHHTNDFYVVDCGVGDVAIRKKDFKVNLTQVFRAARIRNGNGLIIGIQDVVKQRKELDFEMVIGSGIVTGRYTDFWEAMKICDFFHLSLVTQPLRKFQLAYDPQRHGNVGAMLHNASPLSPNERPDAVARIGKSIPPRLLPQTREILFSPPFGLLILGEHQVAINLTDFFVNITNLVKALGEKPGHLKKLRRQNPTIRTTRKGNYPGSYVSFESACDFCVQNGRQDVRNILEDTRRDLKSSAHSEEVERETPLAWGAIEDLPEYISRPEPRSAYTRDVFQKSSTPSSKKSADKPMSQGSKRETPAIPHLSANSFDNMIVLEENYDSQVHPNDDPLLYTRSMSQRSHLSQMQPPPGPERLSSNYFQFLDEESIALE